MPLQHPDDPAREFREVWLGAKGFARWPVDARFEMWMLAGLLWFPCFVALWLVIPAITPVALGVVLFARWVKRHHPARARAAWVLAVLAGLLVLSFRPSLTSWFMPIHWILAALFAPALAVFITSRVGPYVDKNVPLKYRIKVLFAAASRPRRKRKVLDLDVHDELALVGDIDLADFRPSTVSLVKEYR